MFQNNKKRKDDMSKINYLGKGGSSYLATNILIRCRSFSVFFKLTGLFADRKNQ